MDSYVEQDSKVLEFPVLRPHPIQAKYLNSQSRFNVVPAGRRGGKSEIGLRRAIIKALTVTTDESRVILAAPTHNQAKRIFWSRLKKMVPKEFILGTPMDGELIIKLVNGCIIWVTGLDVPERVEGPPLDHILLDEYGNMKENVWGEHVRPALSDHLGSADFIGVPEGRNHYFDLYEQAKTRENWSVFDWVSADILPASEIEEAKRDLDELTFQQEYGGKFVNFQGRAYYGFTDANIRPCSYDPNKDLIFAFDFNASPGVVAILQEKEFTECIGEVYIPKNSNTEKICQNLVNLWKIHHNKRVEIDGDATGGAQGSAKLDGSDWEIVRSGLKGYFRLAMKYPKGNPRERVRVNAMNSRICNIAGERKFFVDPSCKYVIKDFEGVRTKKDGSGDLDKTSDPKLTHISDGIGYYIDRRWPMKHRIFKTECLI